MGQYVLLSINGVRHLPADTRVRAHPGKSARDRATQENEQAGYAAGLLAERDIIQSASV